LERENKSLRAEISGHVETLRQKTSQGNQELKLQTSSLERDLEKQQKVIEALEADLLRQRQLTVDIENKLSQRLVHFPSYHFLINQLAFS
jgi:hypothetical protein